MIAKKSLAIPSLENNPTITAVTFEVFRYGGRGPEAKTFLYDADERISGQSLNDVALDCNQYFQNLVSDKTVTRASTSISFDHTSPVPRVLLGVVHDGRPLPISNEATANPPESIGQLIGAMVSTMESSGEFAGATPEAVPFLYVAAMTVPTCLAS